MLGRVADPFSTVTWRDTALPSAYVTAVMWLAATHGLSSTTAWFWGRDGFNPTLKMSHEFAGADFWASSFTEAGPFWKGCALFAAVRRRDMPRHYVAQRWGIRITAAQRPQRNLYSVGTWY